MQYIKIIFSVLLFSILLVSCTSGDTSNKKSKNDSNAENNLQNTSKSTTESGAPISSDLKKESIDEEDVNIKDEASKEINDDNDNSDEEKPEYKENNKTIKYFTWYNEDKDQLSSNPVSRDKAWETKDYFKVYYHPSGYIDRIKSYKDKKYKKTYIFRYDHNGKKTKRVTYFKKNLRELLFYDKSGKNIKSWYKYKIPKNSTENNDEKRKVDVKIVYASDGTLNKKVYYDDDDKILKEVGMSSETKDVDYEKRYSYHKNGKVQKIELWGPELTVDPKYREAGEFYLGSISYYDEEGKLSKEEFYNRERQTLGHYYTYTYTKDGITKDEYNGKKEHLSVYKYDKSGKFLDKKIIKKGKIEDNI